MPEEKNVVTPVFKWAKATELKPNLYANFVNVSWTLFDVRLTFGQLVPEVPGEKEFVVEQQGSATIAWPEAKALRDMLVNVVDSYEKTNGEIKPIKLPAAPG